MPVAISNRLLPLLAGTVVVMLVIVTLKSCTDQAEEPLVLDSIPQAPAPDADTPADTIKTLTADGPDQVWYYPDPCPLVEPIRDHLAFWGDRIEYRRSEV